jgi:hypothetical protein
MGDSIFLGTVTRTAGLLFREHGNLSADIAADRAEERFANIDVGGFAYWKSVEKILDRMRPPAA